MALGIEKIGDPGDTGNVQNMVFLKKIKFMLNIDKTIAKKKKSNPLYGKKFNLVVSLTKPFPVSHLYPYDVQLTFAVLKKFIFQIGGKIRKKILYTDSLFGFIREKRKKTMLKSYRYGKSII